MPESVLQLGQYAFDACTNLVGVYFKGDAPAAGYQLFYYVDNVTAYYLPGTRGWGNTYADRPTAWWVLLNPIILTRINFGVRLNGFGLLTSWATNASIVVEACTNLNDARWVPLTTNTLSYGTNYFSDPAWTNNPSRFYRIRRP
jgi:hypothetical protein